MEELHCQLCQKIRSCTASWADLRDNLTSELRWWAAAILWTAVGRACSSARFVTACEIQCLFVLDKWHSCPGSDTTSDGRLLGGSEEGGRE